ncbi:MAG: hypothetical protein ACTHMM_21245 [Agriterribacter sp.]
MNELFARLQKLYEADYISFTPEQKEEAGKDIGKWFWAGDVQASGEGILFDYIPETPTWLTPYFDSYKLKLVKLKFL